MSGIQFSGCANSSVSDSVLVDFNIGSVLYVVEKANKGILQKVVIKTYKVLQSRKTHGRYVTQYYDTYNSIWFTDELCVLAEAQILYDAYIARTTVENTADLTFGGEAAFSVQSLVPITYAPPSELFILQRAKKGVLEKVVIKTYKVIRISGQFVVQYYDTLNRIWFENDLCLEEDAIDFAEAYLVSQLPEDSGADIRFGGSAPYAVLANVPIIYAPPSTVFSVSKANKGQIEKVVIKSYKIIKKGGVFIVQYYDTNNRLWFENDICPEEDALAYAERYYQRQAASISALECPPA